RPPVPSSPTTLAPRSVVVGGWWPVGGDRPSIAAVVGPSYFALRTPAPGSRTPTLPPTTGHPPPFLQPRRRRLHGRLECVVTLDLDVALVDLVAAGGEQDVDPGAAEAEVRDAAIGRRDDGVDPAGLVADLDAHPGGDVKAAVAVGPHPVGAGVVGGVGDVEVV